jgi:prepilin-type N-terminal cleavage/methylation domain-containing protein/prepilin-type processing-associated H-X9-DG protein
MATHRRGFTLVELLVVSAIIVVLAGLTLAAVQRARASAARAACANNLRQLGIAFEHHQATLHRLPVGYAAFTPLLKELTGDTWHPQLLPYIEQDALAAAARNAYRRRVPMWNPATIGKGTVIPVYSCPADGQAWEPVNPFGSTPVRDDVWHDPRPVGALALTSYLGIEGTSMYHKDGCLYLDSQVRAADISDGLSNTLLVGERPAADGGPFRCLSSWYTGVWGHGAGGSCATLLGVREPMIYPLPGCPREPGRFQPGRPGNPCDDYHFWSFHPGGANFLFADGSVRFLAYSADPILPALATRAGGEAVALPD